MLAIRETPRKAAHMVRVSFILTILFGLMVLVLSAYIRLELATPQSFPVTAMLAASAIPYEATVHLHGMIAAAMMFFVAAFMGFVTRAVGAPMGHIWGAISIAAGVALGLYCVYETWMLTQGVLPSETWFDHREAHPSISIWETLSHDENYMMAALSMQLLVAGSVSCLSRPYRLGSIILTVVTLSTLAFYITLTYINGRNPGISPFIVPEIVLLSILFIIMVDSNREDEPHLTVGLGMVLMSAFAFDIISGLALKDMSKTFHAVANQHMAQNALLLFVFFAAYFRWLFPTRNLVFEWIHSGILVTALMAVYLPLMVVGQMGGQRETLFAAVEHPYLQAASTLATMVLYVVIGYGMAAPFIHKRSG